MSADYNVAYFETLEQRDSKAVEYLHKGKTISYFLATYNRKYKQAIKVMKQ